MNVNASTSASTSSMDIENNETVDECREISINPNIYTTPGKDFNVTYLFELLYLMHIYLYS